MYSLGSTEIKLLFLRSSVTHVLGQIFSFCFSFSHLLVIPYSFFFFFSLSGTSLIKLLCYVLYVNFVIVCYLALIFYQFTCLLV